MALLLTLQSGLYILSPFEQKCPKEDYFFLTDNNYKSNKFKQVSV